MALLVASVELKYMTQTRMRDRSMIARRAIRSRVLRRSGREGMVCVFVVRGHYRCKFVTLGSVFESV